MPTIDQLTPAAAAADTDQVFVSQNGTARKMTRAQFLAGTQAEIVLPPASLLGRGGPTAGTPAPIALGPGLALNDGVLATTSSGGFDISSLPAGSVPQSADLVPLGQNGGNVAVSYAQFLSGLPGVPNVSASNMTVKATGSTATQKMADFAANTLPKSGGQMSGPLVLAGNPFLANQAANKQYVDQGDAARVARSGDTMTGPLVLHADPVVALGAASKQYVDGTLAARVAKAGDTMTGPLTVPALTAFQFGYSLTQPIVNVQLAGSTPTTPGPMVVSQQTTHAGGPEAAVSQILHLPLTISNGTVDGAPEGPADNRWSLGAIVTSEALQAQGSNPDRSQHGAAYMHVVRAAPAGGIPAGKKGAELWNSWQITQDRTNEPSSRAGALVGLEHDVFANNRDDAQARFHRQVVLSTYKPLSEGGQPLEWAYGDYWNSTTGGDNDSFFNVVQAVYAGYTVAGIDFSMGMGERANPYVDGVNRAAAIKLRAGQRIALDGDGATGKVITYNGATQRLEFRSGGAPVFQVADSGRLASGAGITVGWQLVVSANAALGASNAFFGSIVFCTGNGAAYTITLPPAAQVPAGVGFTFAVIGTGAVSLATTGADTVMAGAPTLRQHDRLHLVSNGADQWVEVFHANLRAPRFSGPPVLPAYTVAALPGGQPAGAKAFASNGRKPGQAAGAGTGVEVFYDGSAWISVSSGAAVTA